MMRWYEWVLVFVGGSVLLFLGFFMAGKFQEALESPSGAAYGWAIGVFVALLLGIVGVSIAFSWMRNRDARKEKQKQEIAPASTKGQVLPDVLPQENKS
jgi:NADH:ubiquinone oxidoreductase subunit 6 (subunit J)